MKWWNDLSIEAKRMLVIYVHQKSGTITQPPPIASYVQTLPEDQNTRAQLALAYLELRESFK